MHTEFWWGILLENDQLLRLRRWEKNIKWVVMTAVIEIGSGLCPMVGYGIISDEPSGSATNI